MLRLFAALVDLLQRFFQWKEAEQHRDEGREQEAAQQTARIKEDVKVAEAVRVDVAGRIVVAPDGVREHDEFERPD
jgi:ferritin